MQIIRRDLVKRIHVSQKNLRANRKNGTDLPLFTIQLSTGPIQARYVEIGGRSQMVQGLLKCGARVWIKTRAAVRYLP